jgi:hypothetical protein
MERHRVDAVCVLLQDFDGAQVAPAGATMVGVSPWRSLPPTSSHYTWPPRQVLTVFLRGSLHSEPVTVRRNSLVSWPLGCRVARMLYQGSCSKRLFNSELPEWLEGCLEWEWIFGGKGNFILRVIAFANDGITRVRCLGVWARYPATSALIQVPLVLHKVLTYMSS